MLDDLPRPAIGGEGILTLHVGQKVVAIPFPLVSAVSASLEHREDSEEP